MQGTFRDPDVNAPRGGVPPGRAFYRCIERTPGEYLREHVRMVDFVRSPGAVGARPRV